MAPNSTAEEICETVVFDDVTVDPDAVLEAFGTDSPDSIVAEAEADAVRTDPDRADADSEEPDAHWSADEELEAIGAVAEVLFDDRPDEAAATLSEVRSDGETDGTDAVDAGESTVFEDVTVDPDAVLDAFGDESPEEIAAGAETGPGRSADEEFEAIDVVAEDLFADLPETVADDADEAAGASSGPERTDGDAPEIFVSRPMVVVEEDTDEFFESIFGDEGAPSEADDDEPKLVGAGPEPKRVENATFGSNVPSGASDGLVGGAPRVERV